MAGKNIKPHSDAASADDLLTPITLSATEVSYQGHLLRSVTVDGTVWFVSGDACSALEIVDPQSTVRRLDRDEKRKVRLFTSGGEQELNVVNESGLYLLAFNSRKAEAAKFRKWVTNEVLPSLRRTATGERQGSADGSAYVRLPGRGRFRVTVGFEGKVSVDELEPRSYVDDFYSPEVDALALATGLVGALWRKYRLLDSMSAFNEQSNTCFQLAAAIRQAEHIAQSAMRTKRELVDEAENPTP